MVARAYELPPEKLRVSDAFARELAFQERGVVNDDIWDLSENVLTKAAKTGTSVDLRSVERVGDFVRLIDLIERAGDENAAGPG